MKMKYTAAVTNRIMRQQFQSSVDSFRQTELDPMYEPEKDLRAVALMELYNAMNEAGFFVDTADIGSVNRATVDRAHAIAQQAFSVLV
jgi:hypothetical protein